MNNNNNNKMKSNEIESNKVKIKDKIYPFIDEMVNTFYTENCNSMIKRSIETEDDKKTFLMFVMMYFGIHFKLENENDKVKKEQIKLILTDLIRDPESRRCCVEMFESKFKLESSSNDNKNLLIKDNKQ